MKKLNNKGITTIEVIICFVLVVIITVSMYGTISSFNEKRILEQEKEQIYSWKNTLTKDIEDDFIKIGLTHALYERTIDPSTKSTIHTVKCELKDGTDRQLIIEQRLAKSTYHIGGTASEDYFMVKYGQANNMIEYPLPDLGSGDEDGKIKNLSINNVYISVSDDNVLSIYIGLYHPTFSTRYALKVTAPIDYVSYESNDSSNWSY